MQGLTPLVTPLVVALVAGGCAGVAERGLEVPAPQEWRARASESAEGRGAEMALDGQTNTWWRSGAEQPQWIEVDLGASASVGGVSLHWGRPFASSYAVRTSLDGERWALAHETKEGDGGWDLVLFDPVVARHVRIVVEQGLQGTGAALGRLEVLGPMDRPQLRVDGEPNPDAMELLNWRASRTWRSTNAAAKLEIDLRREQRIGSVRVDWGVAGYASNVEMAVSTNGLEWSPAGAIASRGDDFDALLCDRVHAARYLRLSFSGASSPSGFEVKGLALLGEEGRARPWASYELVARQAPEGVYPDGFRNRQTYWTLAGGGAEGDAESWLDEWGTFAADARSPTIAPLLATPEGVLSARQAQRIEHRLAGDASPLPETTWKMASGLSLRIRAMARSGTQPPTSWVGYELVNESLGVQTGRLAWVVRPVRLGAARSPAPFAPTYRMRGADSGNGWRELWADRRRVYAVPQGDASFGSAPFAGGDVAEYFLRGQTPSANSARDDEGLASAAWWIDYALEPGDRARMVVAALSPGDRGASAKTAPWPEVDGGIEKAADAFEREWVAATWEWRAQTGRYAPKIARPDAMDALHAQVGWLLAMRRGGERPDWTAAALRAAALARVGQAGAARDWVARAAADLADSGDPVSAAGPFAFMAMETYRFVRDGHFLQTHYPAMRAALADVQRIREARIPDDSRLPVEDRELLEGLLPTAGDGPARTYLDQYWALLGWKELLAAASILGHEEDAEWAKGQYDALKASVRRSLRVNLDRRESAWLPARTHGDFFDAAGVAMLFWPCDETDLVFPHELQSSLDEFYARFLARDPSAPGIVMPSDESLLLAPLSSMGRGDYAREVLYALLDRRKPDGWHTWADVATGDPRKPGLVGGMPDVRSAAAYVVGVRGLALRETGGRLDLFSGAPAEWLQHGQGYRVYVAPTAFGPLDLCGHWHRDRMEVEIGGGANPPEGYRIWWPRQIAPERVLANGEPIESFDAMGATLPHDFKGKVDVLFPFLAPWPRDP
jgi:hypothetical protein